MTEEELNYEYINWMYSTVCDDRYSKEGYRLLFDELYATEFIYILPIDGNRAEDGEELRYTFGRENGYSDVVIKEYLDNRPCSVLEMMLALSIRCEEHIMTNDEYGNRVGQWFWEMIVSLGLGQMTDSKFDIQYVRTTIDNFLNRNYAPNGEGGLFTIEDKTKDMREIDIWYQMCAYLNEVL